MPVVINKETGLAEDLPLDISQESLNKDTHEIPLIGKEGELISTDLSGAQQLLAQGYRQPNTQELDSLLTKAKYSSPTEQAKAALEGAASGATFGLSTAAETALGVNPEDIQARRETNPLAYGAGQAAGLVGSAFLPVGSAAKALTGAGETAAKALGLGITEGAPLYKQVAQGVGSAFAKGAVENAMFQAGDELSKMFASDPNQTIESAITDVGLSSLLGGGLTAPFGAASPMWNAAKGSELAKFLTHFKDRVNGLETKSISPELDDMARKVGIELTPEMRAGLSDNPKLRNDFAVLQDSLTKGGKELQQSIKNFKDSLQDASLNAIGTTRDNVEKLAKLSPYEAGTQLKDTLKKEISTLFDPFEKPFNELKEKYSKLEVTNARKAVISDEINSFINESGANLLPGSKESAQFDRLLTGLSKAETLEDLRKINSQIQKELRSDFTLNPFRKAVGQAFNDAESAILEKHLGEKSSEELMHHLGLKEAYKQIRPVLDDLNDRLHVGGYGGAKSFSSALEEMKPEDILRRLTNKKDAGLLAVLEGSFPETSKAVKEHLLSELTKQASDKALAGQVVNPRVLFKAIDEWSPELKSYVFKPDTVQKIDNVRTLLQAIPERFNPSGTAKTLDNLWSKMPAGVGGAIGALGEAGVAKGYILGELAHYLSREAPDAARLSMLKFMGSNQPINSRGFKAMFDYIDMAAKGQSKINEATKAVFKSGAKVIPESLFPDNKSREKLQKRLDDVKKDYTQILNTGADLNHYLPDHGSSIGLTAARAINYLETLRPNKGRISPLDNDLIPNKFETSRYETALNIAEQPLIVLDKVKNGTVTPFDVQSIKAMFPAIYNKLSQNLINDMSIALENEEIIPYKTKLGLSLFLGTNLDSTMTPQAISANQFSSMQSEMQKQKTGSMKDLQSIVNQTQTVQHARQLEKSTAKV